MITGVHALIFSDAADDVRAFLRDKLEWPHVDDGNGWLIFALPPAELGVHPTGGGAGPEQRHELYLMCDDIEQTMAELEAKGVEFASPVTDMGFGLAAWVQLPGGTLGIYEPRHSSPLFPGKG